ncbi:MAG: sulfite exporter TauE/SafE family protein [Halioglobus sp.]
MITDPWFYLAAVPAVLITGMSKGGFGGIALLAVPLLALTISPVQAAGIMLPILLVMDAQGVREYRGTYDKRNLLILIPGAILGILAGGLTAQFINDDLIRLFVGTIAILFAVHFFVKGRFAAAVKNPNAAPGVILGMCSGFTSFLAHAGGPTFQLYMLPQKLDRRTYAGTAIIFFAVVNFIKLVPYSILGMLAPGNLLTSLVLIPLAIVGVKLGVWANKKLSNEIFYKTIYTAIFLVGLMLYGQVLGRS